MKELLTGKVYPYEEVARLVSGHLGEIGNLQGFCREHGLEYNTVVLIKNNYKKQYPKVMKRLMEIFDYRIEKVTAFKFTEK